MKPLVRVTWNDAQDLGESWSDEATVVEFGAIDCEIVSVGFVVSKGPKYLTLAADEHTAEGDYGRVVKIPVAWIVQEEALIPAASDHSE